MEDFKYSSDECSGDDYNEDLPRSKTHKTSKSLGNGFIVYPMNDTAATISEVYASPDADYLKECIQSEMIPILANVTWEITDRPYGCRLVGCKLEFERKHISLKITMLSLLPRVIPKRKENISSILTHMCLN